MKRVEDFDASIDVLQERIFRLKNQRLIYLFLMLGFGVGYIFVLLIGVKVSAIPYTLIVFSLLIMIVSGFLVSGLAFVSIYYDKMLYNFIIHFKKLEEKK